MEGTERTRGERDVLKRRDALNRPNALGQRDAFEEEEVLEQRDALEEGEVPEHRDALNRPNALEQRDGLEEGEDSGPGRGSASAAAGRSNVTSWRTLHIGEDGVARELEDEIASEYALTVMLNGEEFGTLVCSPTHQEELVYGFLASEGAIRSVSQVKKLTIDDERGYAYVVLDGMPLIDRERSSKRFIGSCCGKGRQFYFQGDMLTARTIMTRMTVTAEQVWALMARLQMSSADFISTGGVHNAALCTPDELLAVRTDIGRHNALDKLYGYSMLRNIRMKDKLIAFSGRLSSEVVLKSAKMGCGLLLSKSAPTDLALKLADELGITCIGFIRGRRLSVYTHRERLIITGQLP